MFSGVMATQLQHNNRKDYNNANTSLLFWWQYGLILVNKTRLFIYTNKKHRCIDNMIRYCVCVGWSLRSSAKPHKETHLFVPVLMFWSLTLVICNTWNTIGVNFLESNENKIRNLSDGPCFKSLRHMVIIFSLQISTHSRRFLSDLHPCRL